jgi:hypothetical protein
MKLGPMKGNHGKINFGQNKGKKTFLTLLVPQNGIDHLKIK